MVGCYMENAFIISLFPGGILKDEEKALPIVFVICFGSGHGDDGFFGVRVGGPEK